MKWRTAIFDLDGTVSDPFEGIYKSINHALAAYGYPPATPGQVRTMIGPPLSDIFNALLGEVSEARMLELVDAYRDRYARVGYAENVLYDDMKPAIAKLAEAGYRLGVCTSKRADYAEKIVDMFGLLTHFDFIDGGDIHIQKDSQLKALISNDLDPGTAVMIGDRAVDVRAAAANGMSSIGVTWGFGDREELAAASAEHIVDTPEELVQLLI